MLKAIFNIKNAMYVCICAAVTDHDILETIAEGATSFEEVAGCTGAGTGCGACISTIMDLVENRDETPRRCLRVLTSAA
jgi:bacterioferritin-associated ferredoxin